MIQVLILEDNENDALLMARSMSEAGLNATWDRAKDEATFKSLLNDELDVILADYHLPNFSALDAIRMVRKSGLDVPVVVVTGTLSAQSALECIEAGAADYLFKDRLERLGVAVTRALQQRQVNQAKHRLQVAQAQFIQNVSHEFRTPLALITGNAGLLASTDNRLSLGRLNDEQQEAVEVICRRGAQLNRLINDILILMELDQARLDGGYRGLRNLSRLNLSTQVALAINGFEPLAQEQNIALVEHVQTNVFVYGSENLVSAMIENLISNALKFTSEGQVAVSLRSADGKAVLNVMDTGIGMSLDDLAHIFDRFCQVDGSPTRMYGGTGLGLSVVQEVARSMDGSIDVESALGIGSKFTIMLPLEV